LDEEKMKHEFKVTRSKDQTVYTLESASSGGTSSGSGASVSTALGGVQRRPTDSIFAQEAKKDESPKPRNFVAKNAKMGGAGKMKDKSKTLPRHEKHKKPVAEGDDGRDKFYYQRNNIWRVMDGDELVYKYTPDRYEVVGAKKLLARFDDEGYDVTHVISPMGVVTYLYGKPEDDMEEGVAEGWQEDSQELEDWSKEVNKRLYRAHDSQRPALARQLSKIEQKNFGSSLNQGSLTQLVHSALMALQKGQMVHYDPQQVGQMPFGNVVGDEAKLIAKYNITRDELAGYRMLHDKNMVDSLEQFLKLRRLVRAKSWPLDYYEELEKLTPEEAWLKMANDLNWSKDNTNEEVQAKTDDKLLAYYAQRKAEKEQQGVAEGPNDGEEDNFTIDDIKRLEKIRDLETLKAQAKELIKGKPARRMKPEKISWFYNHIDTLRNPLAVIKMMYDLMLAGEGHKVIGSRNSMSSNSYRTRFGEDHEIQMASSELQSIAKNAEHLLDLVRKYSEQEGLQAWQQSKITKAADYLNSVLQSVNGEQSGMEEARNNYHANTTGFGRRPRDDEQHDLDTQTDPSETMMWNLTINGKPLNPKPIMGRSNLIKFGKQQAASGVDLSNAMISPVKNVEEDAYMMELASKLAEKIPPNADVDYYIKDFAKSTAPQFKGKNPAKRKQMAIAAYYGSKQKKK
jgi:hypothetical protein